MGTRSTGCRARGLGRSLSAAELCCRWCYWSSRACRWGRDRPDAGRVGRQRRAAPVGSGHLHRHRRRAGLPLLYQPVPAALQRTEADQEMRCTVASCGGAAGLRAAVLGRALCVGVLGGVNSGLPRVPCRTRCALLLLSLSSCTTSYEVCLVFLSPLLVSVCLLDACLCVDMCVNPNPPPSPPPPPYICLLDACLCVDMCVIYYVNQAGLSGL